MIDIDGIEENYSQIPLYDYQKWPYRKSVYRPSNDYWCGSYQYNYVKVTLSPGIDGSILSCVSVWGNDDFGCNKSFDTISMAEQMFNRLQNMLYIDADYLEILGFEW
jgi:hypothetical protein